MKTKIEERFLNSARLAARTWARGGVLLALLGCVRVASAQILAYDDASSYTSGTNGANQGFGFGPWTMINTAYTNNSYTGFYVNSPGDRITSTNGHVWGLYAHGRSSTNAIVISRPFLHPLATNTVFTIKWQSTGIGPSPTNRGGICLRHGDAAGSVADYHSGARFELFYCGGGHDAFQIVDGTGTNKTVLGFGSNPFQVEFALLTSNMYRLDVLSAAGAPLLTGWTKPLAGTGSIDSVSLYAFETDGDQMFNNMEICAASLIPPQLLNIYPANDASYVFFTNKISFDAISAFSTLPANGFKVLVNGRAMTRLSVTGKANQRHVVVNDLLPESQVITAVAIATDANRNAVTNVFNLRSAVLACDDASSYTSGTNGANQGFGFGPWTMVNTANTKNNYTGFYVNTTGGSIASTNGHVWGFYAHGRSGTNAVVACRPFVHALAAKTVFTIKWQSTSIGSSPTNRAGICLRHGQAAGSVVDFHSGARFELFYCGGGRDALQIVDGTGTNKTALNFGSNPFQVEFALLTPNTYRLDVLSATGAPLLTGRTKPLAGTGSIDSVSLYALQTDGDQMFNNMEICSVSLIPPQLLNLYPANDASYVFFTNKISFDAISAYSTLPASGFKVQVNGQMMTNLSVTGTAIQRHVVVKDLLPENQVITAVVIATDANRNAVTNRMTFNTFDLNQPLVFNVRSANLFLSPTND